MAANVADPGGAIIAGQEEGGIIAVTELGQEGENQAVGSLEAQNAIEVSECGIQVGDLDEYAEYFECFLKIGDCLPKIIVCGTDDEMPRIVVCEGLKRRPPVDATEETKKVLLEIQTRVAEMINAVQINTILREEINHIEGDCPVIQLKEVMQRIKETAGPSEDNEIHPNTPARVSCKHLADDYSCAFTAKSATQNSVRSFQSYEKSRSKDNFQPLCSMCLKRTQPLYAGCFCDACGGRCHPSASAFSLPHNLESKASDEFTDDDVRAIINKCLGPPCNTCLADKYDTIVGDLDIEEMNFSNAGQKIYDIIVPPGYKDKRGWGGNHNIENAFFPPQQDSCNTQKYAETVEELKGELSKLDKLGDVLTGGDNMFGDSIGCESASCINAANYLNNQIAQIEEDLDILRKCLERSRKERKILEAQQNMYSCVESGCCHR